MLEAKPIGLPSDLPTLGYKKIKERMTPELVFAFVEPIGGGAEDAAKTLELLLKSVPFKYGVNVIKISELIDLEAVNMSLDEPQLHQKLAILKHPVSTEARRVDRLQQLGNAIRKRKGNDFLAKKAIQKISEYRADKNGFEQASGATPVPKPFRHAHIIKSIKNEYEYQILKAVYGDMFYLVAVSCSYSKQISNFGFHSETEKQRKRYQLEYDVLASIDQYEDGIDYGQRVQKVFFKADLFLNNEQNSVEGSLKKFLKLLFGLEIKSPNQDEMMMYEAFAASLRSTCLSRQVGAAISDLYGDLISVGWNGVPAYSGGVSVDIDDEKGNESLCKSNGYCRSDKEIKVRASQIFNKMKNGKLLRSDVTLDKFKDFVKREFFSDLIEFSRAIHAEMEALISAARSGKQGVRHGTIYITTYPCDNCAKHILAAGIKRAVYIEPYPKSRAIDFFSDFIVESEGANHIEGKLILSQFVGISPKAYPLLFRKISARKDSEGDVLPPPDEPIPITNVFLDSFAIYESQIAKEARGDE